MNFNIIENLNEEFINDLYNDVIENGDKNNLTFWWRCAWRAYCVSSRRSLSGYSNYFCQTENGCYVSTGGYYYDARCSVCSSGAGYWYMDYCSR